MSISAKSSNVKLHVFRLKPHQDIRNEISAWALQNKINACCNVTCVGSLEQFHLRFADQENGTKQKGHFEIVSFSGTFSGSSSHFHLSVADSDGQLTGGHVLEGNLVYTTAEIVVAELYDLSFLRQKDDAYGYTELVVNEKHSTEKNG